MSTYLGMRPGDLDGKPYAKYWNPNMGPMQRHVVDALHHGVEASELGFDLDEADQLLKPGYLQLENGYTQLPSGRTFVAVRTAMPGVTGAMVEWWMGWHYMENQRYKLWHPRSHIANGTEEMRGDDPDLSDVEKYMTTHYVTEYIGNRRESITITFVEPATFFGENKTFNAGGATALICGRVGLQRAPITVGYLVHQLRETDEGAELRSRFWLGKPELTGKRSSDWRNRVVGSIAKRALSNDIGREMVVHCAMEMNHLASFLPALYADYHSET